MKRFVISAGVFALVVAVAVAQDTRPAQPPAAAGRPAQAKTAPPQPGTWALPATRVTAAKMLLLEEDLETLEAQRDIRRAYARAAEVAVKSAELSYAHFAKLAKANTISQQELEKGRLELEAAKAQLEIRMAEIKEIEVKIKYAKKRLDDAKAAGVRPPPARGVDPPPPQ